MIWSEKRFRLSEKERQRIILLTGGLPETTSIVGLNKYLEAAKGLYTGDSAEEVLIRHLIETCMIDQE